MLERMRELICEYVETDPAEITENTAIRTELGLNSYELVSLLVAFEDEFGVELSERAAAGFQTLGDVMEYIEQQKAVS